MSMNKQELRGWAVEQAIKLHGPNGVTTDKIVAEARALLKFVGEEDAAKGDKPAA